MQFKNQHTTTYLQLFFGMAFFGSATPVSKLVVEHFPTFIAGGLRVLMAFLILLPFVKVGNLAKYRGKDGWLLAGIGLVGVVGFTAFLLYGMRQVSGVTGSIIMSATPALTAFLSYLFFKDPLGWKKILSITLAVAGIFLIAFGGNSADGQEVNYWGIVLIIAAICCEAGYTLMGKALTKDYSPTEVAAFSALIGFVGFIPFGFLQYECDVFHRVSLEGWLALIWYGVGTMGVGSLLWYNGVKNVPGSTAAAFMGVMPVSALLLSYFLLDESFQWVHLGGFSLVFAGVLLIIQMHRKQH